MNTAVAIGADERSKERSILVAVVADSCIITAMLICGLAGGSLTIIAETIRSVLMLLIEVFSFLVMRRVHRATLFDLDFGTGKLERIANLAIAASMLIGSIWIAHSAWGVIAGHRELGTPLGLTIAAMIAGVNTWINVVTYDGMRRAARTGRSVIMQAQLHARMVKLCSSLFVQVTMTVAAVTSDGTVAVWAEATGAFFVAGFILWNAWGMFRTGLPDLLDRSVGEEVQIAINRALATHFDEYALLHRVRTRRSGSAVFIELVLGYDDAVPMAEIARRVAAMKQTLHADIDGADITIEATASAA